jgi:maltose alpha-D-glucosyltransferase/alpha-amylase
MGDNIWLHDRDAVRTPMQLNQSLVSHYGHVNVEAQLAQPTSLLHWIHGMLTVRRKHASLGKGDFEVVPSSSEAVLTFLRTSGEETLLVVANMAATPRSTTVTLDGYAGAHLSDVFGGAQFPDVTAEGTVQITLGSREFYWLMITPGGASSTVAGA